MDCLVIVVTFLATAEFYLRKIGDNERTEKRRHHPRYPVFCLFEARKSLVFQCRSYITPWYHGTCNEKLLTFITAIENMSQAVSSPIVNNSVVDVSFLAFNGHKQLQTYSVMRVIPHSKRRNWQKSDKLNCLSHPPSTQSGLARVGTYSFNFEALFYVSLTSRSVHYIT